MLQTRNGKRTAMAALKFSMDMYKEKLIDWKTAVMRNPCRSAEQLLGAGVRRVGSRQGEGDRDRGLPGRARRRRPVQIYLNAERAVTAAEKGQKVLLVRIETSPRICAA
jgi:pyruvate,orthophosphate dikinase